jgi:hypothetical protein
MKSYIKSVVLPFVTCCVLNLQAHKFTFKNHLKVPVTVSLHLVAKSDYDTKVIPAAKDGKPGEGSFGFDGWYAGFCFDSNTLKLDNKELPVVFTSQKIRDQILGEMMASGRTTTYALGNARHTLPGICQNQEFDIVVDRDGVTRALMVHGSY